VQQGKENPCRDVMRADERKQGSVRIHNPASVQKKENAMNEKSKFECGTCFYQAFAEGFTPISVSANFAALECPKCLNNDSESFVEIETMETIAA
jgi:hypothetical protein